ncbi:MAG: GNAT family N-acetyltransferase [bacterium]
MELKPFDREFFDSLPGHEEVVIEPDGIYYTITLHGEKAGVVGAIPSREPKSAFVQIVLAPEFRGRGLTSRAEDELARLHELKTLFATINNDNFASLKAHSKAGFTILSEEKLTHLRELGKLKPNQIRMEKNY